MFYGVCEKCGEDVRDPEQPAYPVRGWEVGRTGGGANAIRNRERQPNRVRHVGCIPRPGKTEGQEQLRRDNGFQNERYYTCDSGHVFGVVIETVLGFRADAALTCPWCADDREVREIPKPYPRP